MESIILHADDRLAVASLGNVFVNVLRQPLTLDGIARLRELSKQMWDRFDGKYGALTLIEPGAAGVIPEEVRRASSKFAGEFAIRGAAIVVEGSGFRPAATRTLIAGVYLLIKKQYPHKICSTATEGASWLLDRLESGTDTPRAQQIVAAAEAARQSIK